MYLKCRDYLVAAVTLRGLFHRGFGAVEQHEEVDVEGGEREGKGVEPEDAGQNSLARRILND